MAGRIALEILNDVADSLGYEQIETLEGDIPPFDRKMLRAFNRVIRTLSGMQQWFFLREEGEITTVAPYTLGMVEVTNGSTTVTGVDDLDTTATDPPVWTAAMEGRAFAVTGDSLVYRIEKVNSATSLTLNRAYQGTTATGADAVHYTIAQDRYDLPVDFDRPNDDWSNFLTSEQQVLKIVSPEQLANIRRQRSRVLTTEEPEVFALWGYDDTGNQRRVVLDPFPSNARVITFFYHKNHPEIELDVDRVLFPLRYDSMLVEGVAYLMRRDVDDDARAQLLLVDWLRERTEGLGKKEEGQQRTQISPSGLRRVAERMKWGRDVNKIDLGDYFDRFDVHDL